MPTGRNEAAERFVLILTPPGRSSKRRDRKIYPQLAAPRFGLPGNPCGTFPRVRPVPETLCPPIAIIDPFRGLCFVGLAARVSRCSGAVQMHSWKCSLVLDAGKGNKNGAHTVRPLAMQT
jgi:hypothetical protein